jgi:hypothetical protein
VCAERTLGGRPPFAASQREKILELLRAAGPRGVPRAELIFSHHMTQCATRIFELRKIGFVIRSEDRGGDYPTWYVLESEPLNLQPIPTGADWCEGEHRRRPSKTSGLPLFDAGV